MTRFPARDWLRTSPEQEGLDTRRLADAVGVLQRICGNQGVSQCLVVRNGALVWSGDDIDARHAVWSVTKSVLSLTLGLLIDDGRCTLDTRAAEIHAPLAERYPTMTLRHLATFTSGYQPREASEVAPPFEPDAPLFAPGERFHYGWDPFLLALLLTKLAGEPLRDLFRRRIADPIGLDPAAWRWGDWGAHDRLTGLSGVPVCGGSGMFGRGLEITARALGRLGWLVACGGTWEDRQVIGRRYLAEATCPQVPGNLLPHDPQAWYTPLPGRYGYYWWTNGLGPDNARLWPSAPPRTFAMQGNQDNWCFIIPEWQLVVVRLGTDGPLVNWRLDEFFQALGRAFLPRMELESFGEKH